MLCWCFVRFSNSGVKAIAAIGGDEEAATREDLPLQREKNRASNEQEEGEAKTEENRSYGPRRGLIFPLFQQPFPYSRV